MREPLVPQFAQRLTVTSVMVICSLAFWFALLFESWSYPVGAQDYGMPLTFRRIYDPTIDLFFPQALVFDLVFATVVIATNGYSVWRWSSSWSLRFQVFVVLTLATFAALLFPPLRADSPNISAPFMLVMTFLAVPLIWICSLAYASWSLVKRLVGAELAMLAPFGLLIATWMMGWLCRPHDIFLDRHDPRAIPALTAYLSDQNPRLRSLSVQALRGRGPFDEQTSTAIVLAMSDPDDATRSDAISLASELGPHAPKAVPILLEHFLKNDGGTFALAELGPVAKAAVPALEERLGSSEGYSKLAIARALWRIDGNTTLVVPALIALLDDEFGPIRVDAATLLGEIGPASKEALPILREMVAHVPNKNEPAPDRDDAPDKKQVSNAPRTQQMSDSKFYPQIKSAAEDAIRKIQRVE